MFKFVKIGACFSLALPILPLCLHLLNLAPPFFSEVEAGSSPSSLGELTHCLVRRTIFAFLTPSVRLFDRPTLLIPFPIC